MAPEGSRTATVGARDRASSRRSGRDFVCVVTSPSTHGRRTVSSIRTGGFAGLISLVRTDGFARVVPVVRVRLIAYAAVLAGLVAASSLLGGCAARDGATGASAARIGTPVDAATIAKLDTAVTPDGRGLPPGRGSVTQGAALYDERCSQCHESPVVPALWGGVGSLSRIPPQKTVGSYWPYATTLYDYIARAMPPGAERSLSPSDVYALSAYILAQNAIVPKSAVLDATTLAKVAMPNRDGFVTAGATPDP